MNSHIFDIRDNLKIFGFHYVLWTEGFSPHTLYKIWSFHYVLWTEGFSPHTLYKIWIAYGMIRHDKTMLSLKGQL